MSTEPTGPHPADDEPNEPTKPSDAADSAGRPERSQPEPSGPPAASGGRTWPIVLIVLGVIMLLLALGMQLPGPAYVGVVPLCYGFGTLAAVRAMDRSVGQRRIALFSGLAAIVLVFALGTHLALADEDLELDLGFGVLATVLAAALTGIHLAAARGAGGDDAA